jgi:hypothetical protein
VTSGRSLTAAERRARGEVNVNLWLPCDYVKRLDAMCADEGLDRVAMVQILIDTYEERDGQKK